MPDVFSPDERSRVMATVHSQDTRLELRIRALLDQIRVDYLLNDRQLPGKPDIVIADLRKVIFIHGCFWHQHEGCKNAARPSSNTEYWNRKLDRTIERDKKNIAMLKEACWDVLIIWECETKNIEKTLLAIIAYLDEGQAEGGINHRSI